MKLILLAISCLACVMQANSQHTLTKLWETDTVFKIPESALLDKNASLLYVSNIEGKDPGLKDGLGSIGKLSTEGKILEIEWVKGLSSAKGMGIFQNKLYVADLKRVVVIDIAKGAITDSIAFNDAAGLNDISINPQGVVFVSDPKGKKVYQIKDRSYEVYADSLNGPNGVRWYNGALYVADAGRLVHINADKSKRVIAEGMEGGTDGLEPIGNGDFLVTCWSGTIWYVEANGKKQLLIDRKEEKKNTADLAYDQDKKILYVPSFFGNTITAFKLN